MTFTKRMEALIAMNKALFCAPFEALNAHRGTHHSQRFDQDLVRLRLLQAQAKTES